MVIFIFLKSTYFLIFFKIISREWQIVLMCFLIYSISINVYCSYVFFLIIAVFYWSIVDLQCFVSFGCTAKWFSYMYFFQILFPCRLLQNIEYSSLCYSLSLLVTCLCMKESESHSVPVWLFETPWTIQSMDFSRPEHRSE